eukprot:12891848-Prorocentrum_lima.AAC.1
MRAAAAATPLPAYRLLAAAATLLPPGWFRVRGRSSGVRGILSGAPALGMCIGGAAGAVVGGGGCGVLGVG